MAFPTDWSCKCSLVIQASKIDSNQSDFPVLLTKDTLPSEMFDADGSYPALDGGGDIRFSSDSSGSTQLACEVVTFTTDNDPTNGVSEIWVKVPSISSSTNTTIYVWYNKAGESQPSSSDTYGSENVWDSNFKMVQHTGDATTSTIVDSTSNSNDGTKKAANEPIETTGQIGEGQSFDGSDDYITLTNMAETANGSISLWFKPTNDINSSSSKQILVVNADDGSITLFFQFNFFAADGKASFALHYNESWNKINSTETSWTAGNWYYLTVVWGSDGLKIYVNDSLSNYDNALTGAPENIAENWRIGVYSTSYFNGTINEVCISSIARSANWTKACYNNQNDPSTFVIEGTPFTPSYIKSVAGVLLTSVANINNVDIGNIKSINKIKQ